MTTAEVIRLARNIVASVVGGTNHDEGFHDRVRLHEFTTLHKLDNQDFATLVRLSTGEGVRQ